MFNHPHPASHTKVMSVAFLLLSCLLLVQYLQNRSLWIDESMLAMNILCRNFSDLLLPLDDHQVAPVLFLMIEKTATLMFGRSELALRLFPFLCAIASLPLFYFVCLRLTGNRPLSLLAVVLLGCMPQFLYYSSEVKQYICDLLVMLVLYYAAFARNSFLKRRRGWVLAVAGAVAIFLSNVSVIVLCSIGLLFVYDSWRTKNIRRDQWAPAIVWAFCFSVNYLLFLYNHPHAQYMKSYWTDAFMPANLFSPAFRHWMNRSIGQLFRDLLPALPWGYLFLSSVLLYGAGLAIMLWKGQLRLLYVCIAPVIIHLLLSLLKVYPFELRLILYQAPLFVMVLSYAIWHLSNALAGRPSLRLAAACAITGLLSFKVFLNFPIEHDEVKASIQYINEHSKAGESLYVFRGAIPPLRYYQETGIARFDSLRVVLGASRKRNAGSYIMELKPFRGRVWLLASHIYPYNGNHEEEIQVLRSLQKRGSLLREFRTTGSNVYELDLR